MLHPWLRLALDRPDLLVNHASAYAALAQSTAQATIASWRWRLVCLVLLVVGAVLAVGLAGVALMLHALNLTQPTTATLWLVPMVPALVAALGGWLALRPSPPSTQDWAQQFASDVALFKDHR